VADDFVTLDDLADFMEVDVGDLPTSAQGMLSAAQAAVRNYLGGPPGGQDISFVADDEEEYDGRNRDKIRLNQRPVRTVTLVMVDDEELAAEDWNLRYSVLRRTDGSPFPQGYGTVVVTYDHGWDASDSSDPEALFLPEDLKTATLMIARRMVTRLGETDEESLSGETIGAYSYQSGGGGTTQSERVLIYADEQMLLDPYRVRLVP
jgi:hypothetical protein